MQAYLKSGYGVHICSVCGQRYDIAEYINGYSLWHILTATVKCKRCGAILSEPPKRCYYSDYHSGENACTECVNLNGVDICTQQATERKQELLAWGYYYKCPYYKPKEPQQLTFWEV